MEKKIAIAATSVAALFIGGTIAVVQLNKAPQDFAQCGATAVAGSAIGGPFELVDSDGETVTDADVITGPSVIYFGYTFCPDVCPLDAMRNAQATYILDEKGIEVTPIFISIDPERDTPEVVGEFASNFHERMIGLTGSLEQTDAASKAYRTYYKKEENGDPEYYLVDHSIQSYFNIPGYGVIDVFGHTETPENVAQRMECLIDMTG
ncbi:SCO family protein [Marivivens niveibacter]|uniref:SCO family protein n=1 Tax=Marivivens niveibacter TaxID=1930667 RepID=A0A251WZ50_9RHOB|nr:SCO family protein [Marivivens niveibacter]OUD09717.1 SCO family protein [Marivivens niveibacter]